MINISINQKQYQQSLYFQYRSDTEMFAGDGDRWRFSVRPVGPVRAGGTGECSSPLHP